jgi:hypothetical protein
MKREELKEIVQSNTNELYSLPSCDKVTVEVTEKNDGDAVLKAICKAEATCRETKPQPYTLTEEHKEKISKALKGRTFTEEVKERMRQNNNRRMNVYQYTLDGRFVAAWASTHEVERQLGFGSSLIARVCKGCPGKKTAYGYVWRYKPLHELEQELSIRVEKTYK